MNELKNIKIPQGNGVLPCVSDSTYFDTYQIETFVGEMEDGMSDEEMQKCRKKLIILHQCCKDKEALIGQLKMMIRGIEDDFDWFAS